MEQRVHPIPAEHYGADYFNGVTSNYVNGYTWDGLGQMFTIAARFLSGLFPDATDFLDFGAATGLLVRALREHGKLAWGVEHSPYCLQTAEAEAKPYLYAALDDLPEGATFDVVTAFETLEHLTQAQIAEVLPALRQRTGHAMFCTIPCSDMTHKAAREAADKDTSHISILPKAWWHEQFEAAGFRHGPWQRMAERFCMQHPHVQQMGWQVFVLGVTA